MLYPLKFRPRLKQRIWGGDILIEKKGKGQRLDKSQKYGESWDLSGVRGDLSVVTNGTLKGNNIEELTEVYMGDLVGEKIFERYGLEFPLLIKTIDAQDKLSIQVHPDDALAAERHNSYGKTEMWYVAGCQQGAALYVGFNRPVTREEYIEAVATNRLPELLNRFEVKEGDTYFIPAGTIHAIGKGLEIIEIQQTSDITYRVYDWGRVDSNGNPRELHTALAVDAIDFESKTDCNVTKAPAVNQSVELVKCDYFTTNVVEIDGELTRDFASLDSFVIYIGVTGSIELSSEDSVETVAAGDSVLVPAESNEVTLKGKGRLLEVYIG